MATINAADYVKQPYIGSSEKTRNKAIDPKLEKILAQVASETGVTFVVSSGGQDAKGTKNARRTGSTRHDHGGAGDVMAKGPDGKFIDFSTPAGQKQWGNIVARARSLGATGIGAGKDYMGTQTVHIGFGTPATWSSVKSGQPVEPWLKASYDAGAKMPPGSIPVNASRTAVASQLDTEQRAIPTATQDALRSAGFNPGRSDGVHGPRTDAAIRAFQSKNGLNVDGVVGPNTLAALQRATVASRSAPSPAPSGGVTVAPQSAAEPGSAFRGGFGSTGFTFDRPQPAPSNAFKFTPANDTQRWGWQSPFFESGRNVIASQTPGIELGGIINTANAFANPTITVNGGATAVATDRSVRPRPPRRTPPSSGGYHGGRTVEQDMEGSATGGHRGGRAVQTQHLGTPRKPRK